ncbi:MAG: molybdenum cofactor guanylyltransferase [Planctomycetota bacterium]|jgi:molybdopterin-guanine dinucleotide biosynthesis protein A
MIEIPGMLMVGSRCKSDGKTVFTRTLIERFGSQRDIVGVKVTTVDSFNTSHHPEVADGPRSDSSGVPYYLTEEKDARSNTDTGKMLAAGAKRVLWLLALKNHLEQGAKALLEELGERCVSICESNRARSVIEPDAFLMIEGTESRDWKPSALDVVGYADRLVQSDATGFDIGPNDIQLLDDRWVVRVPATVIILAGGGSSRMGRDKSMLPVAGKPMIKHIYEQLQPHFAQTLVSSNNATLHDFLGATVVADDVAGRGPMMGIVSALRASANDVNFVVACDMPEIDTVLMRAMLRQASDYDAVVPKVGADLYEPLFAVYRKSALPVMEALLESGNNKIIDSYSRCRVLYVDLDGRQFRNINTRAEYSGLVEERGDDGVYGAHD